jgi:hypothetical protein
LTNLQLNRESQAKQTLDLWFLLCSLYKSLVKYTICGWALAMLARNLNREMQMMGGKRQRHTTERRTLSWHCEQLGRMRRKLIQRAGRFARP